MSECLSRLTGCPFRSSIARACEVSAVTANQPGIFAVQNFASAILHIVVQLILQLPPLSSLTTFDCDIWIDSVKPGGIAP